MTPAIGPGARVYGSHPYQLGPKKFQGGEGAIFAVQGRPDLYAKIYLHTVPPAKADKLAALVAVPDKAVRDVSAWPTEVLREPATRAVTGILVPVVTAAQPLHQAATPGDRLASRPGTSLANLAAMAANLAHAVATFHAAGLVIGDLSAANALVRTDSTVRLIDCDSVQLKGFPSDVALAENLPPELQGKDLRKVRRTADHDNFALAVLIFKLLYLGRHPYAVDSDVSLIEAIRLGRHAFTRSGASAVAGITGLVFEDVLTPPMERMFRRAFGKGWFTSRPTAFEWWKRLSDYQRALSRCSVNATHAYPGKHCPWCALERAGRPSFFPASARLRLYPPARPRASWQSGANKLIARHLPALARVRTSAADVQWNTKRVLLALFVLYCVGKHLETRLGSDAGTRETPQYQAPVAPDQPRPKANAAKKHTALRDTQRRKKVRQLPDIEDPEITIARKRAHRAAEKDDGTGAGARDGRRLGTIPWPERRGSRPVR